MSMELIANSWLESLVPRGGIDQDEEMLPTSCQITGGVDIVTNPASSAVEALLTPESSLE
jgi:hypothetical protein